jgi:predicted phage baseplate assembly protein
VPRSAAAGRAHASYSLGGGAAGNLGRGGTWAEESGAVTADNAVAAVGGSEPEPVESARQRAADALTVPDRIVTAEDARQLALDTAGVAVERAHVRTGHHPGFPCVSLAAVLSVIVLPSVDRDGPVADWVRAPHPDEGLLGAVRARLEGARLLGQEVFVEAPVYRELRLELTLTRSAGPDTVEGRVVEELTRYLDPLRGGPDEEGWPFGGTVRPSELVGVASRAAGPEMSVTSLAVALDDGEPTDCAELAIGPGELVRLVSVHVTRTDVLPSGGGLR